MITWWQVLIVFFLVGLQARLDEKLSQDPDFKRGVGLLLRFVVTTAIYVGAWLLLGAWVPGGINW